MIFNTKLIKETAEEIYREMYNAGLTELEMEYVLKKIETLQNIKYK